MKFIDYLEVVCLRFWVINVLYVMVLGLNKIMSFGLNFKVIKNLVKWYENKFCIYICY